MFGRLFGPKDELEDSKLLEEAIPGVALITKIFQADGPEGVCRGIAQTWIAAHLDSSKFGMADQIAQWRKDVADLKGEGGRFFKNIQDDLDRNVDKMSGRGPLTQDGVMMLVSCQRAAGTDLTGKVGALTLSEFCRDFTGYCNLNGFYYLGVPDHAMAMYVGSRKCLFLDANTGEWFVPGKLTMPLFTKHYFNIMYPKWSGRKITMLYRFSGHAWLPD